MNTYSDVLISDLSENGFRGVLDTTDQYDVVVTGVYSERECDRLQYFLKLRHYVHSFSITRMYSTHCTAIEYAIGVHVHSVHSDDSLRSMTHRVQSLLIDGVCIRVELSDIDVQQYGAAYRVRVILYDTEALCLCYAYIRDKFQYSYLLVDQECDYYVLSFELDMPDGEEDESHA